MGKKRKINVILLMKPSQPVYDKKIGVELNMIK